MIGIVDYGLGNIRAFKNVYDRLNLPVFIASNPIELRRATRIILPGVGAFDDAVGRLDRSGMRSALEELVHVHSVPVLGVCVGMQMLACTSEEGQNSGLGWVNGHVKRIPAGSPESAIYIPHMGWNEVRAVRKDVLFSGLDRDARFYFLHSYYFDVEAKNEVIAVVEYGTEFTCAIRSGSIFGVQFHPEKSHWWGMRLLENFARAKL